MLIKALEVTKEMLNLANDAEINIEEYPKIYEANFSLLDIFKDNTKKINISSELVPDEIMSDLDILDMLPVLYSDDMLMILPCKIDTE